MRIKEKKHRLPEEAYEGRVAVSYTACLHDRSQLLATEELVTPLLEILEQAVTKYHCIVPVYCFMPDHAHFIVSGDGPNSRANYAVNLFKQRSGFFLKPLGIRLQKDFHDHVVRASEDFHQHVWYILNNPVRAGLASNPLDYPFTGSLGIDLQKVISREM